MAIINKVTKLYIQSGVTEETVQEHLDAHNADGWYLVAVDNQVGWYRFFWAKAVE